MLIGNVYVLILYPGEKLSVLSDTRHYIQGVSWDPCGLMLATLSSDRLVTNVYLKRANSLQYASCR